MSELKVPCAFFKIRRSSAPVSSLSLNKARRSMRLVRVAHRFIIILAIACVPVVATSGDLAASPLICAADQATTALPLAEAVVKSLSDEPKLIIAKENWTESRADLSASTAAFLPAGQLLVDAERYAPSTNIPVQVVGSNVIGGPRSDSVYGALNVSWNLFSSGKDLAGRHGAKAAVRSTSAGLDSQLNDTLSDILQAYADLHDAQLTVEYQSRTVAALKVIAMQADERFRGGQGTTVARGQARAEALNAERTFYRDCRDVYDKAEAMAESFGHQLLPGHLIKVLEPLPASDKSALAESDLDALIELDPAVVAAKEQITVSEEKRKQTQAAFGPTLSLSARRDYLGESPDGVGEAGRHIGPNSYRVDVSLQQPIFPFLAEHGAVTKASAEVRKAQATYLRARLDAEKRLQGALNVAREALASYSAAKSSLSESREVLSLTRSQYQAGRAKLDDVQHAEMDVDRAQTDVDNLGSRNLLAGWQLQRALQPQEFVHTLFAILGIPMAADQWRGARSGATLTPDP
jgi:outer membrane protein TolC